jgi:hypothetical protein
MDRRTFFRSMGVLAGAFALDPEELLWRPTKKIFIPPDKTAFALIEARMNEAVRKMTEALAREIYQPSPLFIALQDGKAGEYIGARLIPPREFYKSISWDPEKSNAICEP